MHHHSFTEVFFLIYLETKRGVHNIPDVKKLYPLTASNTSAFLG